MNIPAKPWTKEKLPKRILAIRLQAMGDVVITLPYLQQLRNSLPPSVRLDLLTREETEDIPRNIVLFDKVFSLGGGRHHRKQVLLTFFLLPKLLLQRYDMIIDLQNNRISQIVRTFLRPAAWCVFDKLSPVAAGERTRLTIEAAGLGANAMRTQLQLKDKGRGVAVLKNNGWNGTDSLVVLNPAGAFETRNWSMPNYAAFARLWLQRFPGTRFVVLGTSFIAEKASFLQQELGDRILNLINKTSPADAFAVLQQVSLVVSEDGGLMHMAWVSGIPTLALFGGTRSDWSRPLGPHTFLFDSSDLPCGNCMQVHCKFGDIHCLTRYTPELVLEKALLLLNR
jgi:heptosyltransferase II